MSEPEKPLNTQSAENGSESGNQNTELEAKIAELEDQLANERNRYMYLYADFENHKKRSIKERSDLIKFGWEAIARELLEVIDNIERALDHMSPQTDKTLVDGLHMVLNQFKATLMKYGVQPIESVGKPFDPNFHEAIAQLPHDEIPQGAIVAEQSKGYTLHDRLLRASRVVVSTGKPAKS